MTATLFATLRGLRGNLIKKFHPNGLTLYVGGLYEVEFNTGGQVTKKTSYYPAGGAIRVDVVGGSNTVSYVLRDHLGSASVTLDASGNAMAEMRYYPFGETRVTSGAMPTDRLYTGQRALLLPFSRLHAPKPLATIACGQPQSQVTVDPPSTSELCSLFGRDQRIIG